MSAEVIPLTCALSPEILQMIIDRAAGIAASPYRNREMAAMYLGKSVAYVDVLRMTGRLKPDYCGVTPLFKVTDLEAIIREDTLSGKRRQGKQRKEEAA